MVFGGGWSKKLAEGIIDQRISAPPPAQVLLYRGCGNEGVTPIYLLHNCGAEITTSDHQESAISFMHLHPIGGRLECQDNECNERWAFIEIRRKIRVKVERVSPYLFTAEPECSELGFR